MKRIIIVLRKNKNRLIYFLIIAAVVVGVLFRMGIFTPSKSFYLWYFENNKDDFENVVSYVKENDSVIDIANLIDLKNIKDYSVRNSIIKIMISGDFEAVSGSSKSLIFRCSNLIDRKGEAVAIVYNSNCSNKEHYEKYWASGDSYIKYSFTYEPICSNWYYKYRSK